VERAASTTRAFRVSRSLSNALEGAGVVRKSGTGTGARFLKFTSDLGFDKLKGESVDIVDSILDVVVIVIDTGVGMALAQRSIDSGKDLWH
jgi:hypothetical protein